MLDFNVSTKNKGAAVTAVVSILTVVAVTVRPELMDWVTDPVKQEQLAKFVTLVLAVVGGVSGLVAGNLKEGK